MSASYRAGFTLIELSIVLVIIGLIVGGILVGKDLISAAQLRATISQVDKFKTAVNTFQLKYDVLPGDMPYETALQTGFSTQDVQGGVRGQSCVLGDGLYISFQLSCETSYFWSELSYANGMNLNLIEGTYGIDSTNSGSPNSGNYLWNGIGSITNTTWLPKDFPPAKLGQNNYFYVYSYQGYNFFGLIYMDVNTFPSSNVMSPTPKLSAQDAYSIDSKVDDGLPLTGAVNIGYQYYTGSDYLNGLPSPHVGAAAGGTAPYSATTCYDTSTSAYATDKGNTSQGCAMSFRL